MAPPYISTALKLANAVANVRSDLNDLDNSAYRWIDDTIKRELDRALDRYSYAAPFLQLIQIPTIANSKLYPIPADSWWVDRLEYPLGLWPKRFQPFRERLSPLIRNPISPPTAHQSPGSHLDGTYKYAYTWTDPSGGQTYPSPLATTTLPPSSSTTLSAILPGPYGTTTRTLYRTVAGGSQLKLLATLPDNRATSFTDDIPDGSLGINAPTSNSTQNNPQLEILLSPDFLPQDSNATLELTYASKHLLDTTGTTIPEEHWDVLHLGAESYLAQQWLGAVNDNFHYVDGQFRDSVDDTKSIDAWRALYESLTTKFEARLREIKAQDNDSISPIARWGDKPYRWDRL